MADVLADMYLWIKALHVISVMAWMAGILYLPRLFVYHAEATKNSELSETFKVMERRLLRIIMNPAMILTWVFGGLMLWADPGLMQNVWMHIKVTFVILMTGYHHALVKWFKAFREDANTRPAKFYRIANEVPTLFLIIIVIMAVAEPF